APLALLGADQGAEDRLDLGGEQAQHDGAFERREREGPGERGERRRVERRGGGRGIGIERLAEEPLRLAAEGAGEGEERRRTVSRHPLDRAHLDGVQYAPSWKWTP